MAVTESDSLVLWIKVVGAQEVLRHAGQRGTRQQQQQQAGHEGQEGGGEVRPPTGEEGHHAEGDHAGSDAPALDD